MNIFRKIGNISFNLVGLGLLMSWTYRLLAMDAYIFLSASTPHLAILVSKRILLAFILSIGLLFSNTIIGRRNYIISIVLITVSLGGSLLLVPEKLQLFSWIFLAGIHGMGLWNLKQKRQGT